MPVLNKHINKSVNLRMYNTEVIVVNITIFTIENGQQKNLYSTEDYCPRTLVTMAKALGRNVLNVIGEMAGLFSGPAKEKIDSITPSEIMDTKVSIDINYSFNEAENLQLSLSMTSATHWDIPFTISIRK